jgi:hypothetical protein
LFAKSFIMRREESKQVMEKRGRGVWGTFIVHGNSFLGPVRPEIYKSRVCVQCVVWGGVEQVERKAS